MPRRPASHARYMQVEQPVKRRYVRRRTAVGTQTYTTVDGTQRVSNLRNYRTVQGRRQRPSAIVRSPAYRWKSFRRAEGAVFPMIGNVTASHKVLMFELDDVPLYDANSSTPSHTDNSNTRLTNSIFAVKSQLELQTRFTHNHAVCMRVLVFRNNGWQESISYGGALPTPTGVSNIFKNFLTKVDEQDDTNGAVLMGQRFNYDLVRSRKQLFLDKTYLINPFQGVAAGGGDADTLSLRRYTFNIPINRWVQFESKRTDSVEWNNRKTGTIWCVCIVASADPANASNAGSVLLEAQNALIFKENA